MSTEDAAIRDVKGAPIFHFGVSEDQGKLIGGIVFKPTATIIALPSRRALQCKVEAMRMAQKDVLFL